MAIEKPNLHEVRVIHPWTFSYYDAFIQEMKKYDGGTERWLAEYSTFKDRSDYFQVMPKLDGGKKVNALSIFWIAPLETDISVAKLYLAADQVGNALSQSVEGTKLVDRLIGVTPYIEVRQDRVNEAGEAVTAQMIARMLSRSGYTDLLTVDIHSREAGKFIEDEGINHVNATATPLLVDIINENDDWVTMDTKIAVLDIGALQRCWHAAKLLGLTAEDLIVFKKERGGHNVVDSSTLLYGDPKEKDLLVFDDLQDTGSSTGKTALGSRVAGCKSVRMLLPHGVLSFPARKNISNLLEEGIVDDWVLTNSLPRGAFLLEGVNNFETVNVAPLLMGLGRLLSQLGKERMLELPGIDPFILQTRNKMEVWKEFADEVGIDWQIINRG